LVEELDTFSFQLVVFGGTQVSDYSARTLIDPSHHHYLMTFLILRTLVDTYLIDPENLPLKLF
jgi:hypothetical protein